MKVIKKTIWVLILLLAIACDFGDTNLDPTRPTDAELKEILPTALTQTAHNLVSIGGRVTGTVVQHFKGIDAQPESYSQYLLDERTLDEFWRTGLYGGAMKDCHILIEKATVADRPHYRGIAKILLAINLGIATSFWGDVPYSDAFQGLENLQPSYDLQQDIYIAVQNLLDDAIDDLENPSSQNPPQNDDLIYQGDPTKWVPTAKALKARYLLHLSKKEPNIAQEVLDVIQSGVFESLKDQPNFPFGENINEANPLPLYCFERPDQLVMGDILFQLLNDTNDPRKDYLTIIENGLPTIFQKDSLQLFWGRFNAPLPLLSLAELKFIEAEALLRIGDTENAESVFQEAVAAHFNQLNMLSPSFQEFISENINFQNQSSFEEKLDWMLQQKHLALFAQNPIESWVDFRRTGYPQLTPPSGINPSFNPSLVIPRRYLYPLSERNANEQNWQEAIQRQDGHLLDVDIWAFKD